MANLTFDFLHNYVTGERRASDPADAYQYDEGHVLEAVVPVAVTSCEIQYWIRGMEKADAYTPTSITQNTDNTYTILGNIPNSYFETYGDLRAYIVVTDGDASITTYEGYIHIKERQMPEDYVDDDPENEAVRVIAEARAAAATATEKAGEAAESAEQAQEILDSIPEDYSQLSEDVSNLKDDFHEYHSELGAGYADQLVSSIENTDQTPYNFRKVPYDSTLEKVEGIVGVDVVLNQYFTFTETTMTGNGITFTRHADGTITASGTATANSTHEIGTIPLIGGHTYLLSGCPQGGGTNKYALYANDTNPQLFDTGAGSIKKQSADTNGRFYIIVYSGQTVDLTFVPQLFDITQMFGTDIIDYVYSLENATIGSGVAWLKQHFGKIFDSGYIPHNPGEMVCVSGLSAKKTVGFNQWDEVWEVGSINNSTGEQTSNPSMIRSKNFIPVLPNTTYYFNTPFTYTYAYEYDSNGNFIANTDPSASTHLLTTGANTHYIKFRSTSGYTTYNHGICINLSDPAKNGIYEPYTEHTYPLDSTIDLHGILKLDANNQLYADGDIYPPSGQVNHRYGVVDLGTLNWSYESSLGCFVSSAPTPTAKTSFKAICAKYPFMNSYANLTDKTCGYVYNNAVAIKDSAYSDAPSLKASLSGVYMVYELATPTTEQAEPYTQTQICDPNGTEEIISDTVAPVGHVTRYPENLRKKIEGLPWNFASLIAPTEAAFVATRNYTTGSLFIVNNVLYKATANIANGATITPNSNCTSTTLAEVISALS